MPKILPRQQTIPQVIMEQNVTDEDLLLSDEEELITAQKVLENIENAWLNEKFAPEILPQQTEMLELMLGQITHMEENIKQLVNNDIRFVTHRMEIERIRYVIASYLRCRLRKIEDYTQHILQEEDLRSEEEKRLSIEETIFAKEYLESVENHFKTVALQYMPGLQRSDLDQRAVRPNLMSHVFVKAKESVPSVVVGEEDEEVDLVAGSQHIIPYQLISDLVQKGSVQLI